MLAEALDADALLVLTDVPAVMQRLRHARPARRSAGHSPPALRAMGMPAGSMGPKVEAACRFVELTGGMAAIGSLDDAAAILDGKSGTIVTTTGRYRD